MLVERNMLRGTNVMGMSINSAMARGNRHQHSTQGGSGSSEGTQRRNGRQSGRRPLQNANGSGGGGSY